MTTATKTLAELTDDELIRLGVQRGILRQDPGFNPSIEEIRSHDTDKNPHGVFFQSRHINDELKVRNLKDRTGRPW